MWSDSRYLETNTDTNTQMLLVPLLPLDWATSIQMAHEKHILEVGDKNTGTAVFSLHRRLNCESCLIPALTQHMKGDGRTSCWRKEHQQHALHLSAIKVPLHVKCLPLLLSWRKQKKLKGACWKPIELDVTQRRAFVSWTDFWRPLCILYAANK